MKKGFISASGLASCIILAILAIAPLLYVPAKREHVEATVVGHLFYSTQKRDYDLVPAYGRTEVKYFLVVIDNRLVRVENKADYNPPCRTRVDVTISHSFMKDRYYFTGK